MGEVKTNECTVVAVYYKFCLETAENGILTLEYKAEGSRALPVEETLTEETEAENEDAGFDEDDVEFLRSLDPKEWKDQDHYAVLGLKTQRYQASDEDIKRAFRRKVLRHHPDKRKAQGEEIRPDDDYFTCITKAYDILGTVAKRRSYDSVDPEFDDGIPTDRDVKGDFYKTFGPVFELNARWSEKKNVPLLGDENSPREKVEHFYSFWYNFESWREFSYLDEEEKEKGQDRDERRWIEKQNKAARAKRKKEEMSRIRTLVDSAYNADPRIVKFKQEDKDRKLAAKRAKQDAAQARKDEEERILKEAKIAKEKAEEAERMRIEAKRLEREAQKKALKKEKRIFRDFCKSNSYFAENESETLMHMSEMEKICEAFSLLELEKLNKDIQTNGRSVFMEAFENMNNRIEAEKKASLQVAQQKETNGMKTSNKAATWGPEDIQLLIKAVNLFPAGTNQRWEVVANFINQHTTNGNRFNAKDVLAKAKDLQNTDFSKSNLKMAANKQAFSNFEKEKKSVKLIDEVTITEKVDEAKSAENPWTTTEQQLLEQALKTYPASTPERWDRIAECVPNRSKKDCMRRYKELVETIKAKKAAQASVGK